MFPAASWTWTVTAHVDPGVAAVVGVPLHVLPVMTSFAAGPELVTPRVADPGVRPVTDAVTVQFPGTPVVVTVEPALFAPAPMVTDCGLTEQIVALSTLNVIVCDVVNEVIAPFASFSVPVTLVVWTLPDGNSVRPRVVVTAAGAPATVKFTFTRQPVRNPEDADS